MKIEVWDQLDVAPDDRFVFNWNGYAEKTKQHSILNVLEENSDQLRSEYLAFIHELGQLKFEGKRIVEHLEIEPGFSLWWMTLLAEKSPFKTRALPDSLRMIATRQLLVNNKPKSVELISGNPDLALAMERLCESLKIAFSWSPCKPQKNEWSLRKIWKRLPPIVQAPIHLTRHLLQRWTLRRILQPEWFSGKDSVFLCSYYFNLDQEACDGGRFYSRQWMGFPKQLQLSGKKINWIHHYLPNPVESDVASAIKWMREFNRDSAQKQGFHRFLDSYLSFGIIIHTLFQWSMLVFRMTRLKKPLKEAVRKHPKGWLWPLLRDDWNRSVCGTEAIQNLLWIQLFDRAMASFPQQRLGLYLCENQGWERAFIHSWKKHGHGRLIAVPHATVRYWDLRYFDDPLVWKAKEALALPLPDQIAVNGLAAWEVLRNAHQPTDRMVEVEALRYLHLGRFKSPKVDHRLNANKPPLKLLILGDIQRNATDSMLQILESSSEYFRQGWELQFKPHPATPVNIADYHDLKLTITNAHLEQLLPQFHTFIVSITTSAAIEAYVTDSPVISILDAEDLNLSPLRGMKGAFFVSSADELRQTLDQIRVHSSNINNSDDIFWTDPEIPRWKALLELVERPAIKMSSQVYVEEPLL